MTTPDAHTVVIKFKAAWPYLLADLSGFNAAILPMKLIKQEGYKAFLKHPVGTGPFMWSSSNPGVSVTLKRTPYYWQKGKPYLNSIVFHVVSADTARATAVLGGQATLAENPPLNQLASLKANRAVRVHVFPSALVELVPLNVRKPPLNNEKVRQAISLAIDRAAIVKAGLFGYGKPATTFLVGPPSQTFQNTSLNLYPFDLAKARQLLQQSGVQLPLHLQFGVSQGVAQQAIATIMQADLAKIGIRLSVLQRDFVSNENALDSGSFTMNTTFWGNFIATRANSHCSGWIRLTAASPTSPASTTRPRSRWCTRPWTPPQPRRHGPCSIRCSRVLPRRRTPSRSTSQNSPTSQPEADRVRSQPLWHLPVRAVQPVEVALHGERESDRASRGDRARGHPADRPLLQCEGLSKVYPRLAAARRASHPR
jgi:ABC-type transport system substrate-binding protein